MTKQSILSALATHVNQRPGLKFANYGDVSAYRSESRRITQQRDDFFKMLALVEHRDIEPEYLVKAFSTAFYGRLSYDAETNSLDYCTGQYWPTEYRAAACAVLAQVLRNYWRQDDESSDANSIRKLARNNLGRGTASRWFS